MERAIVDLLENDTDVSAIIGTRIFPNTIPQDEVFPAIVYSVINTTPTDTKNGVSKLDEIQIDLDLFGVDFNKLNDLADKVRTALDRFSGTKQSQVIGNIVFLNSKSTWDTEAQVYHITQTFNVRQKL